MQLTDSQIERYSRQIIVSGVGGRAQERLLAASVAIVAAPADAAGALAYLAGAGVGRIAMHPVGDRASYAALVARTTDLNPDVSVSLGCDEIPGPRDLILALIGDPPTAETVARLWRAPRIDAEGVREPRCPVAVIARLDAPGRIAILPAPPPCPLCAEVELLTPPGKRAGNAGAIAMVAVTEAFRLLAGVAGQQPEAVLVEFDGYVSRPRAFYRRRTSGGGGGKTRCVCEALS